MANCWFLLELWIISLSCSLLPSWPSLTLRLPRTFLLSPAPFGKSSSTLLTCWGNSLQVETLEDGEGNQIFTVGKTMPFLPPMTGNGKHITYIFMVKLGMRYCFPNIRELYGYAFRQSDGNLTNKPVISHVGLVPCHIDPWKLWRWAAELKHRVST